MGLLGLDPFKMYGVGSILLHLRVNNRIPVREIVFGMYSTGFVLSLFFLILVCSFWLIGFAFMFTNR